MKNNKIIFCKIEFYFVIMWCYEELQKEIAKYDNTREMVLRLNEITKFHAISCGNTHIDIMSIAMSGREINIFLYYKINSGFRFKCVYCNIPTTFADTLKLKIKNCNKITYSACRSCVEYRHKKSCVYCLREKETCNLITKTKITFWLCFPKMPKDIRKLITNLFFKN